MNIINIEHIGKIYGEKVIFKDASFGVQQGDKIGIVGINGTGKSTLLKMIAGEEVPDEGQIVCQNGLKIAWVPQNPVFPPDADVRSCAFGTGGGEEWQIESNLLELGITRLDQKMEELSGGQKRRVVLAATLAGDFDVLLLDEPTNHLDAEMISWLEEYLRSYRGTVLMVTHDLNLALRYADTVVLMAAGRVARADWSGDTVRSRTDKVAHAKYDTTEAADRQIAQRIAALAQKYGTTMTAVSLAWHFAKGVASPVIGATKTAHLDEAVGAFAVSLTAEDVALIDEFYLPHKVMGALAP